MVTGGTSGIGLATATALALQGATLIVVSRDPARTDHTVAQIRKDTGNAAVSGMPVDLSSRTQIAQFAADFQQRHERLDVLINNAGGLFSERRISVDGIEMTLALNHLGYFLLTHALLDSLKAGVKARIVNLASNAHHKGKIDFDNLQGERHYNGWRAYCQSKLANVLFTYQLAERLSGTGITVNALHPGFVATRFGHENWSLFALMIKLGMRIAAISPTKGAETAVYLASSPEVETVTGKYWYEKRPVRSSPLSYNKGITQRLWQASIELTGISTDKTFA